MKSNRFNRIIAVMLTIVMTSMLITPTLAVARDEGKTKKPVSKKNSSGVRASLLESIKAQDDKIEFSPEELEQMRSALLELSDGVQEVSALLSPQARRRAGLKDLGDQTDDQFAEARTQIQQMSGQELTTLRKVLNPAKMRAKLASSRATLNQYKDSVLKGASDTGNRPGLPGIDSFCGGPVPTGVIIASDVVYFLAEAVRDIAQNGCNEVIVALGFGGNLRLACLVTDAIYIIAKAVNQAIHFCDDDYTASVVNANYDRLGHIHDDLEDVKANENTNYTNIIGNATTNTTTITGAVTTAKTDIISNATTNRTTITTAITAAQTAVIVAGDANSAAIINNDNTNKTTIVNNDNANALALTTLVNSALTQIISNANANKDETKNLLLRTQIEADLASTDGSVFVALYETPVTVCFPSLNSLGLPQSGIPASTIQCGLLDLVRSIVSQTIANVGVGSDAQAFFNTGDAQRAAGQYKAAYASYRKAYKAAAKP